MSFTIHATVDFLGRVEYIGASLMQASPGLRAYNANDSKDTKELPKWVNHWF